MREGVPALEWRRYSHATREEVRSSMVQVTRLAHVGLQAKSLSAQAEFYNDRWGLERVDEFGREMFFRADGPDHHVLTLSEGDDAGLHHVALQVPSLDDIDRAYDDLLALG